MIDDQVIDYKETEINTKGILFCKIYFVITVLQFLSVLDGGILGTVAMLVGEVIVIGIWTLLYQKFKLFFPDVKTRAFRYRIMLDVILLITFYFFLKIYYSGGIFLQYILVPINCLVVLTWGYVNYRMGKRIKKYNGFAKLGSFLRLFVSISALFYVYQVITDSNFIRFLYDIIQVYSIYLIYNIFQNKQ